MTSIKLIFTCFLVFSFTLCWAGSSDLSQKIEHQLALRDREGVLKLSHQLEKEVSNKALAHFYLSKGYLLLGSEGIVEHETSLNYINRVLKETETSDALNYDANLFKIQIFLEIGNYKEAIKNIQELLQSKEVNENTFKKFQLEVEQLSLYLRISDLKNAKLLVKMIQNYPPIKQRASDKAKSYMVLGKYFLNTGQIQLAEQNYKKALSSYAESDICHKVDAWHMLAEVEKEKGNIEKAMAIYNDLLKYEEKNGYQHGFIHTLLIASETSLMDNKNKWEMSQYANKAYVYAKKLNNKLRLVQAEMNMGYYQLQLNQTDASILHFNNALQISKKIKAHYWTRSASRFLVNIYTQKGDYKHAFEYQKENSEADQKLQESSQIEKADMVRNVHLMYTYRHEMEASAYELEKKQVHLIIWIAISIGTIGISILLLLLYIKQKRHNLFLTEKALKESERKIQIIQVPPVQVAVNEEEKPETKQTLDDAIYMDLQQKLVAFIDAKGYLEPECSLSILAKEFNTNTAYLSKYINEVLDTSFNQLINEYRILDFIERVKTDKEGRKTYTLDHLASLSGFSSKSTFIRAFKKQTGIAPSVFLKNMGELEGN